MRSQAEVDQVRHLAAAGLKESQIARRTGVPRTSVRRWLNGGAPRYGTARSRGGSCPRCGGEAPPFPSLTIHAYAYLLGLYLGDGCLLRHPRGVYRLHVNLDATHPLIAAESEAAMSLVMPWSRVSTWRDPTVRMLNVVS